MIYRYDVYDVELPMMLYNITVRLLQYEGKVMDVETGAEMTNWTTISAFFLTPSKTMGRSEDGKVNNNIIVNLYVVGWLPILLSIEFSSFKHRLWLSYRVI